MLKAGLYTAWGAGVLTSVSTLYDLAVVYGGWNRGLGILLPASLDVYWLIALAVAMDASRNSRQRVKAAIHAGVALTISVIGNVLYHEMHAGDVRLDRFVAAILVAAIGSVPVLTGAAIAHLSVLARTSTGTGLPVPDGGAPATDPVPVPVLAGAGTAKGTGTGGTARTVPAPPPVPAAAGTEVVDAGTGTGSTGAGSAGTGAGRRGRSLEDLVAEARPVLRAHQAEHGKPMSGDALASELHTSKTKALDVLKVVRGWQPDTAAEAADRPGSGPADHAAAPAAEAAH
jgi:hypothetical protein